MSSKSKVKTLHWTHDLALKNVSLRLTISMGVRINFTGGCLLLCLQDMCVVCGSFGQGAEGRLLACSQCGQCYHPFCVNIKVRPSQSITADPVNQHRS